MLPRSFLLTLGFLLSGCSLLTPLPSATDLGARLEMIPKNRPPLDHPVTIHWDPHMIPFIEAQSDGDLAFTLGMVHAHLRLGQMVLYRHASQGRLAELFGPFMTEIDHTIRILGFDRAVDEMAAMQPPETTFWLQRFVDGINYYQDRVEVLPHEFRVWGYRPEPWTVRDILIMSRLIGTDVNWLTYVGLLPANGKPHFKAVWERTIRMGGGGMTSFDPDGGLPKQEILGAVLNGMSRSGSNSLVVSGSRTRSGFPMMANDPHLGVNLPNMWIIAGFRSPSYHVAGLMFPGMPFVAVGRNPLMVWGGTNMRSASSDLYDASKIPPEQIRVEKSTIGVRWWRDREVAVRVTPMGPIVTDSPLLEDYQGPPVALRWVGHTATDEITALLKAGRAQNSETFRQALATAGVSGQNLLFADKDGHIGHALAVKLPRRHPDRVQAFIQDPTDPRADWYGFQGVMDLPLAVDPPEGFLASANNPPVNIHPPIGYFFGSNDRIRRLKTLLGQARGIDVPWLMQCQRDTLSLGSLDLKERLIRLSGRRSGAAKPNGPGTELWQAFIEWDGRYPASSKGALAFESILYFFAWDYFTRTVGPDAARALLNSQQLVDLLNLENIEPGTPRFAAAKASLESALVAASGVFQKYDSWGDMHRLKMNHTFSRMPLVGRRYRFGDYPADGSRTTLNKTAHGVSDEPHSATYGSCARHISDLSHPDANWFLLLGGQDGYLKSDHFTDQVPLWFQGRYIQLPLQIQTIRKSFPYQTVLEPENR